ncbi:MAG: coenzyme F420-reducing hydrogenase, FrhD protein [Methanobrevibacter sp.]|jgi:coenzyme F420 hydrogenase subunit delta|nr:coenzyme F420-reducing hydrogenase, FrhD protein [Methanobrevibacter sp.]
MPYSAETLVVGCGNVLFKDDGFGPSVIKALEDYFIDKDIPEETMFVDAGTGATHFIFTLPDEKWKKLIVVDVVEFDGEPGTVKIFSPFDMPKGTYQNAHTWPVEEPLHDLAKDIDVIIVGCKPGEISAPDVEMGLTKSVEKAIPKAIDLILKEIGV